MKTHLVIFMCMLAFASVAQAAPGAPCSSDVNGPSSTSAYATVPGETCIQVCDDIAFVSSTPVDCIPPVPMQSFSGATSCRWSVGRTAGTCDGATIPVQEGQQTSGTGGTFTTLATLTGPIAPSVSEYIMLRRSAPVVRVFQMVMPSGCTALDVLLVCQKP